MARKVSRVITRGAQGALPLKSVEASPTPLPVAGFELAQGHSRSTPVAGLMAMFAGAAVLGIYWKGFVLPGARLLHLVAGAILLVWGLRTTLLTKRSPRGMFSWMPYRVAIPREGMVYMVIMGTVFVGALAGRSNLLMLVFGLLAGPFVLNGFVIVTMLKHNTIERRLPERVMAGDLFSVEILFRNRRRWISSWMMVVEDQIRNAREHLQPRILFTRVPPRGLRIGRYEARLMDRGRYEFGPLQLSTRFPLGLVDRAHMLRVGGSLIVHPRIGRLTNHWRREQAQADEMVQQLRPQPGAFEDEFHCLREYRRGDNPRAIHWRTSARRNTLMVREYQQTRDQDLLVVVELWMPRLPSPADLEHVELAVRFAATVCVEHCRQSRESRIFLSISGSRTVRWSGTSGPFSVSSLLDELALAQAGAAADLPALIEESAHVRSTSVRRVFITTRGVNADAPVPSEMAPGEAGRHEMRLRTVHARPEQLGPYVQWIEPAASYRGMS